MLDRTPKIRKYPSTTIWTRHSVGRLSANVRVSIRESPGTRSNCTFPEHSLVKLGCDILRSSRDGVLWNGERLEYPGASSSMISSHRLRLFQGGESPDCCRVLCFVLACDILEDSVDRSIFSYSVESMSSGKSEIELSA